MNATPNARLCLLGSELADAVLVHVGGGGSSGGGGGALAEALLVEADGGGRGCSGTSAAPQGPIDVIIKPHGIRMSVDTEMSVATLKVRAHNSLWRSCNWHFETSIVECNRAGEDRVGAGYRCRVVAADLHGCGDDGRAKGAGHLWCR